MYFYYLHSYTFFKSKPTALVTAAIHTEQNVYGFKIYLYNRFYELSESYLLAV